MENDVVGKKPNEPCVVCQGGKLIPIMKCRARCLSYNGKQEYSVFSHLACQSCSLTYELHKDYRNLEVGDICEPQLANHQNSDSKPQSCPKCTGTLAETKARVSNDTNEALFGERRRYLFCTSCLCVAWALPKEEPSQDSFVTSP